MIYIILNIAIFIMFIFILRYMAKKHYSFSKRVMWSLLFGIVFGILLKNIYSKEIIDGSKVYFEIVSRSYVSLLRMISLPLIMVSITSAIINLKNGKDATKIGTLVIGILLITTSIAAFISEIVTILFKLNANDIVKTSVEIAKGEELITKLSTAQQSISDKIVSFIPANPFLDMTGARATSTIAIVVFCAFVGISILGIKEKKEKSAQILIDFINSIHDVVLRMVTLVLRLTPYGIFALMTNTLATSDIEAILKLLQFVLASYVSLILMYLVHLIIVSFLGLSPIIFIKKTLAVLTFAFTSRTSAGALPLNIKTQEDLGIDNGVANLSATFGLSIGQNGCAGIYPAMLAIMIAPTLGINVLDPIFLIKVILVVTISSLGVAGVGGGATFSAIIVLSTLGFPVELAGLLISVEPLIDMGRTALNVNGSIISGLTTAKILNLLDKDRYRKF